MHLEHKAVRLEAKNVDFEASTFEGFSAGIGNLDDQGDEIQPGAFDKTIRERVSAGKVKYLNGHENRDTKNLWGVVLKAKEQPYERPSGRASKADPGRGLWSLTQVSKSDPEAQVGLHKIAEGILDGLSIGHKPIEWEFAWLSPKYARAAESDENRKDPQPSEWDWLMGRAKRLLIQTAWWEHSSVVWGANSAALAIPGTVKSLLTQVRNAEQGDVTWNPEEVKRAVLALKRLLHDGPLAPGTLREAAGEDAEDVAGAVATLVEGADGLTEAEREFALELAGRYEELTTAIGPERTRLVVRTAIPDAAKAAAPSVAQTLIFPKTHWKGADACKTWAKDHGFKSDKVDETSVSYRLRQRDPGDFERLRTKCLMGSQDPEAEACRVKMVHGPLKTGKTADASELLTGEREADTLYFEPSADDAAEQVAQAAAGDASGRPETRRAEDAAERKAIEDALTALAIIDL